MHERDTHRVGAFDCIDLGRRTRYGTTSIQSVTPRSQRGTVETAFRVDFHVAFHFLVEIAFLLVKAVRLSNSRRDSRLKFDSRTKCNKSDKRQVSRAVAFHQAGQQKRKAHELGRRSNAEGLRFRKESNGRFTPVVFANPWPRWKKKRKKTSTLLRLIRRQMSRETRSVSRWNLRGRRQIVSLGSRTNTSCHGEANDLLAICTIRP